MRIEAGGRAAIPSGIRAALTGSANVVPESLAKASLAGVPSVHGLSTGLGALGLHALFGTSRDLNMGTENVIELTALAVIVVGTWCVIGFLIRLGFISDFLFRTIHAGYVFRSGILILVSQLEDLLGLEIDVNRSVPALGAAAGQQGQPTGRS